MLKTAVERAKRFIPQPAKEAVIAIRRVPRLLTARHRVLPDFIVFGAMRCGTSSLYHTLTEHPQVVAAFRKEVRFFDWHFDRGLDWYRAYFPLRSTLARHQRRAGRALTGEASPEYIFHPMAAERIARTLPEVRLVALLRDPVERAWSHYKHSVRLGVEPLTFEEALAREDERLAGELERMRQPGYRGRAFQDYSYVTQGRYDEHLGSWFEHLAPEQIMIVRAEDLFAEPAGTMARIVGFLGLGPWTPRYLAMNLGRRGELAPGLRAQLRERLAPSVRRLSALLGRDMGWHD